MTKSVEDKIEESNICFSCGSGNLPHPECEPTKEQLEEQLEEQRLYKKEMLREFSITGNYGPADLPTSLPYEQALEIFSSYFKGELSFSSSDVIENEKWWYFPQTWVGCIGYIVEKDTKLIYCLGSGIVSKYFDTEYYSHWAGIKAYMEGAVNAVNSSNACTGS